MLTDVDMAYLYMEPPQEQIMKRNETSVAEVDSSIKSPRGQFSFFKQVIQDAAFQVVGNAQKIMNCIDSEAADYFDETSDITTPTTDSSIFNQLSPESQKNHHKIFLDGYQELWESYSELYLNVKNLSTSYSKKKNGAYTLFSNPATKYLIGEGDRKSEINFINSLIPKLLDPNTLEESVEPEEQSVEWLNQSIKDIQKDEFLLLGACVYIHERISSEYKEAKPTSKLHGILSSIVKGETTSRKESSLNYLKERADKNRIELRLPLEAATNEPESIGTFKQNCSTYVAQFKSIMLVEKNVLNLKPVSEPLTELADDYDLMDDDEITDDEVDRPSL